MQDLSTGDLVPLHGEAFEKFKALVPTMEYRSGIDELLQAAKDEAVPNREHQGPVFEVGEVITIKGGKFRVNGFSRKRLYLDSLPAV